MSPERDDPNDEDQDLYEDVPPRSIFAATWFRVVLVVIVLGVVGAVAVPYVLDWMNPPPMSRTASSPRPSMTPAPSTTPTPVVPDKPAGDRPLTDKPPTDKPSGDRSVMDKAPADKKDPTLVPAPSTSSPPPAPSTSTPPRPDAKSDAKPSPPVPTAKPATDPKATAKATTPEPARPAPTPGDTKSPSAMTSTDGSTKTAAAKPSPAKPEAAAKDDASASKPAATKRAAAKATPPTASAPAGAGPYWVQIGAFKDPGTAKRVAAKLREENFKVEESIKRVGGSTSTAPAPTVAAPAPPGSATDQYDVFVSGMSVEELNKRLAGKGLAAEPASGGVVVKPSLPLRDAVALSKDLAVDGFKVQVRRAGAAATAPAVVSAPTAPAEGGQTLHRVRVGAFTDRTAALAAARELESKGFKPYIARGDQ